MNYVTETIGWFAIVSSQQLLWFVRGKNFGQPFPSLTITGSVEQKAAISSSSSKKQWQNFNMFPEQGTLSNKNLSSAYHYAMEAHNCQKEKQKEKPRGKKKNFEFTAKRKNSRQKEKPQGQNFFDAERSRLFFLPWVFLLAARLFVLPRDFSFCREVFLFTMRWQLWVTVGMELKVFGNFFRKLRSSCRGCPFFR